MDTGRKKDQRKKERKGKEKKGRRKEKERKKEERKKKKKKERKNHTQGPVGEWGARREHQDKYLTCMWDQNLDDRLIGAANHPWLLCIPITKLARSAHVS